MKNFVAIGTSHTQERSGDHIDTDHYVDWRNEQRWSEYLSKKLGYQNYYNRGLGSYGIQSYPARIVSIVNNLNPDFILIEIPSRDRYEFAIEDDEYCSGDALSDNHWAEYGEHGYVGNKKCVPGTYLYKINEGDTDINPVKLDKFQRIRNKLPALVLQQSTRLNVYRNKNYYDDQLLSTCLLISGYLDNQKINHAFFNFNSNIDKSIISKYNISYVNKQIGYKNIHDYINKPTDDIDYYADSVHLNSNHWRKLVDDVFIPYFESRK